MPRPPAPARRRAARRSRGLALVVGLVGLVVGLLSTAPVAATPLAPGDVLAWARRAERESGTPATLLLAVARIESGFDPRAVGPAIPRLAGTRDEHALGLMQFLPSTYEGLAPRVDALTGKALGAAGIWDPESAILAAGRYLADSGAPGDPTRALLAYNDDPDYVAAVLAQQARYEQEFGPGGTAGTIPGGSGAPGVRGTPLAGGGPAGGTAPEFGDPTERDIEAELAGSPLAGHGAFLQRAAESRGLPTTLALAILKQESGYGRAPAQGTRHNYGGLVDPARDGGAGTRRVFRDFPDVESGLDAVIANMASAPYVGLTLSAYINRYLGPPSEGDAGAYLNNALATIAGLGGHATAASIPLPRAGDVTTPPAPGSVPPGGGQVGGTLDTLRALAAAIGEVAKIIRDPGRLVALLLRVALTATIAALGSFADLIAGSVAAALGFDRLQLAFIISPRLTYAFPGTIAWWIACRNLAAAALIVALAGTLLQLLLGQFLGRPLEEALRLLPRLAAGAVLAGLSLTLCRAGIDLTNALSDAASAAIRFPTFGDLLGGTPERIIVGRFLLLCSSTVYVALLLQLLTRTVLIGLLTILSPLAAIAWIHPLTRRWATLWTELFVTRLVATALQTLALTLAGSLIDGITLADPGSFALVIVSIVGYAGVFGVPALVRTGESPSLVRQLVLATAIRQVVGGGRRVLQRHLAPPPPDPVQRQIAALLGGQGQQWQLLGPLAQAGLLPGEPSPSPDGAGGRNGPTGGGTRAALATHAREHLGEQVGQQLRAGTLLRTPGGLHGLGTHPERRARGRFHRAGPVGAPTRSLFAGATLTPRAAARPAGFGLLPARLAPHDLPALVDKAGLASSAVAPDGQLRQYLASGFGIRRHQDETGQAAWRGATLPDLLARDRAFSLAPDDFRRADRLLDPARLLAGGADGAAAGARLRAALQDATDAWHGVALPPDAPPDAMAVTAAVGAFADDFVARHLVRGHAAAAIAPGTAEASGDAAPRRRDEAAERRDLALADYRAGALDRDAAGEAIARAQFAYLGAARPDPSDDWTPPERAALTAWAGRQLDRADGQSAARTRADAILAAARSGALAPAAAREDLAASGFAAHAAAYGGSDTRWEAQGEGLRARFLARADRALADAGIAPAGDPATIPLPPASLAPPRDAPAGAATTATIAATGPATPSVAPARADAPDARPPVPVSVAGDPPPVDPVDARTWFPWPPTPPSPPAPVGLFDPPTSASRTRLPERPVPEYRPDIAPIPVPLPVDYDRARYLGDEPSDGARDRATGQAGEVPRAPFRPRPLTPDDRPVLDAYDALTASDHVLARTGEALTGDARWGRFHANDRHELPPEHPVWSRPPNHWPRLRFTPPELVEEDRVFYYQLPAGYDVRRDGPLYHAERERPLPWLGDEPDYTPAMARLLSRLRDEAGDWPEAVRDDPQAYNHRVADYFARHVAPAPDVAPEQLAAALARARINGDIRHPHPLEHYTSKHVKHLRYSLLRYVRAVRGTIPGVE